MKITTTRLFTASLCSLLLAATLFCGCESVDRVIGGIAKPSARLVGFSFQDADLESASLAMAIEIANPYSVPLPLVDLDYALASKGAAFLTGKANLDGAVPANGKRTIEVPAQLVFREVLAALSGVQPGSLVPYKAELGLGVDAPGVGALRLPIAKQGELPVPAAPEVTVREFNWVEYSLQRVGGVMVLDLVNTNQFPLHMTRLDYDLNLAGTEVARAGLAQQLKLGASGGKGALEIPLEFSPRQLGAGLLSLIMNASADYGIDGEMQVDTSFGPMRLPAAAIGRALSHRR